MPIKWTTWKKQKNSQVQSPQTEPEKIENMNRPVTNTENESVIKKKKNLTNKSPGLDGLVGKFYETFREELTPILMKLFQKSSEEGALPKSFCEATITLLPKPDKDATK